MERGLMVGGEGGRAAGQGCEERYMNTILADRDIRARRLVAGADFIYFTTEPHTHTHTKQNTHRKKNTHTTPHH
jgi:hypothetical protein